MYELPFSRPYYPESIKIGWKRNRKKHVYMNFIVTFHPHFYITGTSNSLPNFRNFHMRFHSRCFSSKGKFQQRWMGRLGGPRGLKLGIPDTLRLHLARPSSCTKKPARPLGQTRRLMTFWWVARGRYPHLPKKLTYQAPPARDGPPNPTRTHSSSHTRGCFRCEGFVLGRVFFDSFKKYKDLTRTRGKYRGLCWPVRSLKQIDTLTTYHFCMELNKAEASFFLW